MTKIAVLTDVHGNLPALEAALAAIQREGVDAIYHTGDAIGMGPFPAECLDLLLTTPRLQCVMGNHDAWFVDGLPTPRPDWLSAGEVAHQRWTHAQLDPALRPAVARWPYALHEAIDGVTIAFLHYALGRSGRDFRPVIRDPTAADLDGLFGGLESDLVFYGHYHPAADCQGRSRYVNPGSLGCHTAPVARYVLLTTGRDGRYTLEPRAVPYDDAPLFAALERRGVPERALIRRVFFPRNIGREW